MNKLRTFFQTLVKSWTSPKYYRDVLKAKYSFSLKFFLAFNVCVAVITALALAVPLSRIDVPAVADGIAQVYPSDLQITSVNNKISINKPLPYVIPFPEKWQSNPSMSAPENLVVFDADQNVHSITDYYSYHTVVLVTESTLYMRSGSQSNDIRVYPFEHLQPFTLNAGMVRSFEQNFLNLLLIRLKLYILVFLAAFLLIVTPIVMLFRFVTVSLYSVFMFIILRLLATSMFHGRLFTYRQVHQVSLHTITLIITATSLLRLTHVFLLHGWLYLFAYVLVTIVMFNGIGQAPSSHPKTKARKRSAKA